MDSRNNRRNQHDRPSSRLRSLGRLRPPQRSTWNRVDLPALRFLRDRRSVLGRLELRSKARVELGRAWRLGSCWSFEEEGNSFGTSELESRREVWLDVTRNRESSFFPAFPLLFSPFDYLRT